MTVLPDFSNYLVYFAFKKLGSRVGRYVFFCRDYERHAKNYNFLAESKQVLFFSIQYVNYDDASNVDLRTT